MNPMQGLVKVEPTVTRQFLPRCPSCNHPHPLANPLHIDPTKCEGCGGPAAEAGEEYTEHVEITDPISRLALWIINTGNAIYRGALRLKDYAERNDP